ncbi:MAG TPA: RNA polymerase sigma factor [Pyrinomonadaceae bacterium]|nr:RNA polymerase sigma factor [Pyrinomonadaceae bacterium]
MLRLRRSSENYRELFVARYDQLLAWAMQLSQGDRAVAEDLLHDLYVLFSIHEPSIDLGQNVDGYLYTCLRNLYLSQLRRAARIRFQQLSIIEYESAKTGLRAIDPRTQIEVQDDLRRICQYACARKESSRMGSVLILRFFHGYYPSEIVRVLRTSRKAVDRRLALARAEARTYLDNVESLAFINGDVGPEIFPVNFARTPADLLSELRQMIFASRQGECLSRDHLRSLYQRSKRDDQTEDMVAMSCAELAHLASCVVCLNEVNRMLKLPPLSQRYLTDATGRDPGGRGGDGGSSTGGGPPEAPKPARARKLIQSGQLDDWDGDAREAFEHKPQELCVAVNGYLLGSQRIGLEQNELTLSLNTEEKPTFVEIFSEQGIRLSLMSVGDPPPEGTGEQGLHVKLSDARALDLKLHFTSPFLTLHVAYNDPSLRSEAEPLESDAIATSPAPLSFPDDSRITPKTEIARKGLSALIESLRRRLFNAAFWLRPGMVTALVALLMVASLLLYLRAPAPVVTAADLLRRAADAEKLAAAHPDAVWHRTINLEEKNAQGDLIARSKIEIWQSVGWGITARRLFNEKGQLVAGDWRRADGVQTLYHHGARPQIQLAPDGRGGAVVIPGFDKVWQVSPSANEFSGLIGDATSTNVEERANAYVVSVESAESVQSADGSARLVRASLVLNRADLHPIEQTLVIRQGSETREYRFVETGSERRAYDAVPLAVFEPEPELLSESMKDKGEGTKENANALSTSPLTPLPLAASAELEVEVLRLIHQTGADLGDEITVHRVPDGKLQVQGIVETEKRKTEIVHALAGVANNPAIKIQVETVAEALKRQQARSQSSSGATTTERRESADRKIPLDAELRQYFSANGWQGAELDQRVNEFAAQIGNRSLQVLRRAGALQRLAHRFSVEQLRSLEPEARGKWLGMLREHAQALQRDLSGLRQELRPFFPSSSGIGPQGVPAMNTDQDLQQATDRLFELCSANDQLLRSAFTASPNNSNVAGVESPRFWSSLRGSEVIAAKIAGTSR